MYFYNNLIYLEHNYYFAKSCNLFFEHHIDANKKQPGGGEVQKPDMFAAWVCIIMFFMYFWNFVVMET